MSPVRVLADEAERLDHLLIRKDDAGRRRDRPGGAPRARRWSLSGARAGNRAARQSPGGRWNAGRHAPRRLAPRRSVQSGGARLRGSSWPAGAAGLRRGLRDVDACVASGLRPLRGGSVPTRGRTAEDAWRRTTARPPRPACTSALRRKTRGDLAASWGAAGPAPPASLASSSSSLEETRSDSTTK